MTSMDGAYFASVRSLSSLRITLLKGCRSPKPASITASKCCRLPVLWKATPRLRSVKADENRLRFLVELDDFDALVRSAHLDKGKELHHTLQRT